MVLSLTTRGFPALIAAWGWAREVLDSDDVGGDAHDGDDAAS